MKNNVTKLALSLVMGLSFIPTATAADAKADMKPTDAKADMKPTDAKADMKPTDAKADMKPTDAKADMKPTDAKAEAKAEAKAADAKAEAKTQEQSMGELVDAVVKAASGISAKDLCDKLNKPEGDLATALKAVTDAGCMLVCYGVDGDDVKAATNSDLIGKTPKTSDDKSVRGLSADKMKDAKDGKVFFTYTNAEKNDRAVVAFNLGDALCTVGCPKK
jgi:hypothetical protein